MSTASSSPPTAAPPPQSSNRLLWLGVAPLLVGAAYCLVQTQAQHAPQQLPHLNPSANLFQQTIFLILASSLSYYAIASILSLSPPTSGMGLVLLRRVHDAKLNWHAHVIRSFLETGFWVSVIGFTYLGSGGGVDVRGGEDGECFGSGSTTISNTCSGNSFGQEGDVIAGWYNPDGVDGRWLTALWSVMMGTISGVGVVLLGDVWTRNLEVRLQYAQPAKDSRRGSMGSHSNDDSAVLMRTSSKMDDTTDHGSIYSNTFASFGAFTILDIFSFLGYQTLSFIFYFPYSTPLSIHQQLIVHVIIATLAGATFVATANVFMRLSPTGKLGEILLKRVTHAVENWRQHPKRSALELGIWLIVVSGSFHLKYFGQVEASSMRRLWALMWALQLGTLVGCALILGGRYWNGEEKERDKILKENTKTKVLEDTSANVSSLPSMSTCPVREKARQEGLVLFDGNWYSVGKFVPHHPGGEEVLEQYLGTDISFVFRVMHRNPTHIMKFRKPLRTATSEETEALTTRRQDICQEMMEDYQLSTERITKLKTEMPKNFDLHAFEKDAMELFEHFSKNGYFKPSVLWLIGKTSLVLFFLSLAIVTMRTLPSWSTSSFIIPGISLGLFWHQCGYMMHDSEHHNLAGNERCNDIMGWLFGTVFLGVNGAWWREEHREHHAFLNTFDDKEGYKDPQMKEDIWIQNKNLIKFFGDDLINFLVNFQHILFLPVIFIAGRIGIVVDSTVTERKFRPWTKLGNVLHVLLHYFILAQSDYPVRVYAIAALWQAILSLQLLGNHYTKPWTRIHAATEGNFCVWQILSTTDFSCPRWLQWSYGGLNFHYSHHLFPTLSREYFRVATPQIKALCDKHGLPFVQVALFRCITEMVVNFNEVRKEFEKHGHGSVALMYT